MPSSPRRLIYLAIVTLFCRPLSRLAQDQYFDGILPDRQASVVLPSVVPGNTTTGEQLRTKLKQSDSDGYDAMQQVNRNASMPQFLGSSPPDTKRSSSNMSHETASKTVSPSPPPHGDKAVSAATSNLDTLHIFANVWVPLSDEEQRVGKKWEVSQRQSLAILKEQLEQLVEDTSGTKYGEGQRTRNIHVHVVTVSSNAVNETRIEQLCAEVAPATVLKCTKEDHVNKGGEMDTLTLLWDHCDANASNDTSESERVIYLHNKGSFHPSVLNNNWRRAMNAAVVHPDCLNPPDETCNACGLQFAAPPRMFAPIFPGNFFTVSCGYVRKLWRPKPTFADKQRRMLRTVYQRLNKKNFNMMFKIRPFNMGENRYTPEHWVGSHPHVRPCQIGIHQQYYIWQDTKVDKDHPPQDHFRFSSFPLEPYNVTRFTDDKRKVLSNPDRRLKDYGLLPGLLHRWIELYNQTPDADSWVWKTLPDGPYWQAQLEKYGRDAVVDTIISHDFDRNQSLEGFLAAS